MPDPEQLSSGAEKNIEVQKAAGDRLEELMNNPEAAGEISKEQIEKTKSEAKHEALEKAVSTESGGAEKDRKPSNTPAPKRHGVVSKKEREKSFKRNMTHVQNQLPLPSRVFSKVIHNKTIEKTSDFIGATVARPDAVLAGAVVAFILVLGVYIVAKSLGYVLSGFETIGAFIVGWALGLLYDYLRVMVTGKR